MPHSTACYIVTLAKTRQDLASCLPQYKTSVACFPSTHVHLHQGSLHSITAIGRYQQTQCAEAAYESTHQNMEKIRDPHGSSTTRFGRPLRPGSDILVRFSRWRHRIDDRIEPTHRLRSCGESRINFDLSIPKLARFSAERSCVRVFNG